MSRFDATQLELNGLFLIKLNQLKDSRGYFERLFCAEEFSKLGWLKNISQVNHTFTSKTGTIRGMHFQMPPYAEMKLIQCVRGEIFDVVVDLRSNSPTFLKAHYQYLSADSGTCLLIPEGFAHGFQTLTDNVELIYLHSEAYRPEAEAGIHFKDKRLGIDWPLQMTNMSDRDAAHPALERDFQGIFL